MLQDYAEYLRNLVDLSGIRPSPSQWTLRNRHGGSNCPGSTRICRSPLNLSTVELDGTFPNHEANPLDPKNLVDLQKFTSGSESRHWASFRPVTRTRCFVVDEKGDPVSPSSIAALVAELGTGTGTGSAVPSHQPHHFFGSTADYCGKRGSTKYVPAWDTVSLKPRWRRRMRSLAGSTRHTTMSATLARRLRAC